MTSSHLQRIMHSRRKRNKCADTLGERTGCCCFSSGYLWVGEVHLVTEFVQPLYQGFFFFFFLLLRKKNNRVSPLLTAFLSFALLACMFLLMLLLSRFSCVRLCPTPETAAHQAPPSLGFSRQEHWSGLPFPSPMHESEK